MADRLLLVVEGPDDKHVFWAVLKRHEFKPEFPIRDEGGFETLLARLSVHLIFERALSCLDEIPFKERRFIESHFTKSLIHTWLAWQDEPGTPFGLAITKRYFDSDGPHVQALLDWLTRLFS
jgi:hypothetical protein